MSLKRHINVVHTKIKKYECNLCLNFTTYELNKFKMHQKRVHEEKKYQCEICEKLFATISALRQHGKYHEKIRENKKWRTPYAGISKESVASRRYQGDN